MTRNTFFAAMMFGLMAMFATNANAQRNLGGRPGPAAREMHVSARGIEMDRRHEMDRHHEMDRRHEMDHRHAMRGHADYRWDHNGYLYGWEGRVRHFDDGRWGYYRDGAWLYYDTFFEPDFYYAHPVAHFHAHHISRTARRVANVAAGVAAVATIVAALTH